VSPDFCNSVTQSLSSDRPRDLYARMVPMVPGKEAGSMNDEA
jgi:hypothetical protein